MAKSRKRSQSRSASRSRGRGRGRSRSQKGGSNFPPSAWGWQLNNLGDGWTQFMNSLTLQPGQSLGAQQSNAIVPQGNLNAQNQQPHLSPNLETQKGGKYRRARSARSARSARRARSASRGRSRKGGSLGSMINQALVPLTLLGLQQKYGKKSRKH
jgi:hypothetical protein